MEEELEVDAVASAGQPVQEIADRLGRLIGQTQGQEGTEQQSHEYSDRDANAEELARMEGAIAPSFEGYCMRTSGTAADQSSSSL